MKLTVLVPSSEYKRLAGARIRYGRIGDELKDLGIELTLREIAKFEVETDDSGILLISKCFDVRSLLIAARSSARGKIVGVDLFDNYFANPADSRLRRYREWLRQFVRFCDFAVCSTEELIRTVRQYHPGLAVHHLRDPAPETPGDLLADRLRRKAAQALSQQRIRVAWFGVGDNQHFPVGLSDLAACAPSLAELGQGGFTVDLTVLTNRRALTAEGLSLIGRLPVATKVSEWSEAAERELLAEAFVAFLPVNAQAFSVAKSLNRATTALSAGCQVLSAGYPLYSPLEPVIYRDPAALLLDLRRGSLRLSPDRLGDYARLAREVASPSREATRLAKFLGGLGAHEPAEALPICLVHGQSTQPDAHKLAKTAGALSIASPYCTAPFDFDVVFRGEAPHLHMFVSRDASRRMLPDARRNLQATEQFGGRPFRHLPGRGERLGPQASNLTLDKKPIAFQLATYCETLATIKQRTGEAFGDSPMIISETSQLPFQETTGESYK